MLLANINEKQSVQIPQIKAKQVIRFFRFLSLPLEVQDMVRFALRACRWPPSNSISGTVV